MLRNRCAGVLMPVSSLPSPYGIGSLGKEAKNFIDFLSKADQKIWQVLPLVPTGYGNSPYSSTCATALNPYFIDVDILKENSLLTEEEIEKYNCNTGKTIDYEVLFKKRIPLLKIAFSRFNRESEEFKNFVENGEYHQFSLFMALKESNNFKPFNLWKDKYRLHEENSLEEFKNSHLDDYLFWQFTQFEFLKEWEKIKDYANSKGIMIVGDMPLYVSDDSVEVWSMPELFLLDENRKLTEVAGVPPDYFSEDGQLWGNPLYNWEKMKEDDFSWWTKRLKKAFNIYDYVRIDHFRGFDRYYAIPFGAKTAKEGEWRDGPKEDLFKGKENWNIIAEDLGILDDGVYRLMKNTGYPGMKILEFAFNGDPDHMYKPSNYDENCVVYTGTHDNATFNEFIDEMKVDEKKAFFEDVKNECAKFNVHFKSINKNIVRRKIIEIAYMSKANFVIIPIQDILGVGKEGHLNRPGIMGSVNWGYKADLTKINLNTILWLKELVLSTGR